MRGETVRVGTRSIAGRDAHGNAVYERVFADVDNVLVAPGATSENKGTTRPDGVWVAYTLYFPKTFAGSLRGATVVVRGTAYEVLGDPGYFDPALCPTDWNMAVEVRGNDG